MKTKHHHAIWIFGSLFAATLVAGTILNPDFWSTPEQRGDALMAEKKFGEAAKVYQDAWRRGVAQFRDGNFKDAATTFARVPGATGAYNAGNASLMHGDYESAIAAYDRAIGFRPDFREALDNKALAIARHDSMKVSEEDRAAESTEAYDPDEIVYDGKNIPESDKSDKMDASAGADKLLQATWLRQVKTTPGQFLKAKFASQDAAPPTPDTP